MVYILRDEWVRSFWIAFILEILSIAIFILVYIVVVLAREIVLQIAVQNESNLWQQSARQFVVSSVTPPAKAPGIPMSKG
jgi:hypothetical protein